MILKLKKGTVAFLNKELLYVDFKSVRLDRVLTNLFIKMYADGQPVLYTIRIILHTIDYTLFFKSIEIGLQCIDSIFLSEC